MTRTPDLKIKLIGVRPSCGPQDLTHHAELAHDLARLSEISFRIRSGKSNGALIVALCAVAPEFSKAPGGMVQNQAAEGEQPHEEQQKQSSVEVQFAVPALEPSPDLAGIQLPPGL